MSKVGNIAKTLLKLFAKVILGFILFTTLATTLVVLNSGDNEFQYSPQENIINDITGLNPVGVDKEIAPTTTNEVIEAILNSNGAISIGGGRYSQGGQISYEDSLHIDMRQFNAVLAFDEAWYQFNFTAWIKTIWSEPTFFDKNFLRKLERKISFTLEFGFKALYAKLIGYASATAYEASDGQVYLTASLPQQVISNLPDGVKILLNGQGRQIISVPRWGEFTRVLPKLAENGVKFQDISGNKQITISFVVPENEPINLSGGRELFSSLLVSDKSQRRIFSLVKVEGLHAVLNTLLQSGIPLEHIYDY